MPAAQEREDDNVVEVGKTTERGAAGLVIDLTGAAEERSVGKTEGSGAAGLVIDLTGAAEERGG